MSSAVSRSARRVVSTFFERDPTTCARELIGCELTWNGAGGIIVETEAYSVRDDEACHTFHRPSARLFVATHPPGTAYVYLNYGMYWLLNFLVKGGSENGFVLIRALQPTRGTGQMSKRRGTDAPRRLCSGPGKLAQALGITGADHGVDVCSSRSVTLSRPETPPAVGADVRVGISRAAHLPWRFVLAGSEFLSVPAGRVIPLKANRTR